METFKIVPGGGANDRGLVLVRNMDSKQWAPRKSGLGIRTGGNVDL